MKVSCPHCHTIYEIDSSQIPAEGRSVQCSNCQTVWMVTAGEPLLLVDPSAAVLNIGTASNSPLEQGSTSKSGPSADDDFVQRLESLENLLTKAQPEIEQSNAKHRESFDEIEEIEISIMGLPAVEPSPEEEARQKAEIYGNSMDEGLSDSESIISLDRKDESMDNAIATENADTSLTDKGDSLDGEPLFASIPKYVTQPRSPIKIMPVFDDEKEEPLAGALEPTISADDQQKIVSQAVERLSASIQIAKEPEREEEVRAELKEENDLIFAEKGSHEDVRAENDIVSLYRSQPLQKPATSSEPISVSQPSSMGDATLDEIKSQEEIETFKMPQEEVFFETSPMRKKDSLSKLLDESAFVEDKAAPKLVVSDIKEPGAKAEIKPDIIETPKRHNSRKPTILTTLGKVDKANIGVETTSQGPSPLGKQPFDDATIEQVHGTSKSSFASPQGKNKVRSTSSKLAPETIEGVAVDGDSSTKRAGSYNKEAKNSGSNEQVSSIAPEVSEPSDQRRRQTKEQKPKVQKPKEKVQKSQSSKFRENFVTGSLFVLTVFVVLIALRYLSDSIASVFPSSQSWIEGYVRVFDEALSSLKGL